MAPLGSALRFALAPATIREQAFWRRRLPLVTDIGASVSLTESSARVRAIQNALEFVVKTRHCKIARGHFA